jgi:hypothetical protein
MVTHNKNRFWEKYDNLNSKHTHDIEGMHHDVSPEIWLKKTKICVYYVKFNTRFSQIYTVFEWSAILFSDQNNKKTIINNTHKWNN